MKACTDLEQSKKLAKILPLESADMFIADVFLKEEQRHSYNFHFLTTWGHKNFDELKERENKFVQFIPCWSLAALLDVLPNFIGDYGKCLYYDVGGYYCGYMVDGDFILTIEETNADNQIDACFEMIIKLNEQKIL